MPENPFLPFVDAVASAMREAAGLPPPEPPPPPGPASGPKVLVFAPHPDDEVIIGGLPLRLQRQCGFSVIDVAVTLGSRVDRQEARLAELRAACAFLGFGLRLPAPRGLEAITPEAAGRNPAGWAAAADRVATLIEAERPRAVFLPHAADWNRTHIGVHLLVMEAMRRLPGLRCRVVETEFWGAMASPNLMVESSVADLADLVAALSLHRGEVARNPYHLRLPAWMADNVRRGAELVGGQGATAPSFPFATLYRIREWRDGALHDLPGASGILPAAESPADLFPD